MNVLVVGGGLSGIAAALRLREAGADARIVEPGSLGGKARTEALTPDWRVEHGPHSFTGRADAVRVLAHSLGIGDRVESADGNARARYLLRAGRLRRAGPGLLMSWPILKGIFRRVEDPPDVSVYEWFASRLGVPFADGPLGAMTAGIWATSPDRIDMETGFAGIHRVVRQHGTIVGALVRRDRGPMGTFTIRGGLGALGDAARVMLGQSGVAAVAAEGLSADGTGWTMTTAQGPLHADALVLAGDARSSAQLLRTLAPDAAQTLDAVEYSPLAVAHWTAADARYPRGFGFLAEPASRVHSLGTLFVGDVLRDRAPVGFRSFATMFADSAITEDHARTAIEAEHRLLTGHAVALERLHIIRHARAVSVPRPGHAKRMAALRAALPAGVTLAGAYLGAGAMDDAVRSGLAAAATLLNQRRRHAA